MMQIRMRNSFWFFPAFLFIAGSLLPACACAQAGRTAPALKTDTVKNKPKMMASWGAWTNGSKAFVADIKKLIATNPQVIMKDEKGQAFKVSSFEFTWKKKDISDDMRTGKQKTVFYFVGGTIQGSQFPTDWKEEITNFIQKGEEISFTNILYADPKRKLPVKGPSLVITVN